MSERDKQDVWSDPQAFRQRVRLPAAQVALLSPEELAAALAYEVEPFSNIPAAAAEVAWREAEEPDASVKAFDVAVVRREKRGNAGRMPSAWLWAFAVLALVAVAGDFAFLTWRIDRLERTVAEQTPLDAQLRSLAAEARSYEDEAARVRDVRTRWCEAQDRVAILRAAYARLMDAVASVCGGRTVVKRFASDGVFSVEMRAVAVSAPACAEVLADLTRAAAAKGWRLEPGEIAASAQGTTAEFSCRLVFEDASGKEPSP